MLKRLFLVFTLVSSIDLCFGQDSISKKLNELFRFYEEQQLFNGSVLVAKKGEILLHKGFGFQNKGLQLKNEPGSIFRVYSITKTFTASVILKLVEESKLSLTDKLSKFYPDFVNGDSISIEQLLTHTSGIYDYTRGNNMPDQTEKSFVEFEKTKPLDFPPGSNWSYSNSGYYFLGYIIQKVTGLSYEEAVSKYILEPLQMKQTGFGFKNLVSQQKAIGYSLFTEKTQKLSIIYDPPGPFAAGALHSTVDDLYKYYQGLKEHKILRRETLDKAYTPFKNNYGYGWILVSQFGKQTVGHSGGGAGFTSNFVQIPEDDICIILLSNCETDLNGITGEILKRFYNQPYHIPTVIPVKKEILARYRGTYEVNENLVLYVGIENNKLAVQPKGQGKNTLFAEAENKFYSKEINGYVYFKSNQAKQIDTLVFEQNGQAIKAKRIYPSWGIIGSSTPYGWEGKDITLTKTAKKDVWTIKNLSLADGEIKFRFNGDWTINLGETDKGSLTQDGANIKIKKGVYTIVLDLTKPENPTYKIIRQ